VNRRRADELHTPLRNTTTKGESAKDLCHEGRTPVRISHTVAHTVTNGRPKKPNADEAQTLLRKMGQNGKVIYNAPGQKKGIKNAHRGKVLLKKLLWGGGGGGGGGGGDILDKRSPECSSDGFTRAP